MSARVSGVVVAVAFVAASFPPLVQAAKVYYADTLPKNGSRQVSVTYRTGPWNSQACGGGSFSQRLRSLSWMTGVFDGR